MIENHGKTLHITFMDDREEHCFLDNDESKYEVVGQVLVVKSILGCWGIKAYPLFNIRCFEIQRNTTTTEEMIK